MKIFTGATILGADGQRVPTSLVVMYVTKNKSGAVGQTIRLFGPRETFATSIILSQNKAMLVSAQCVCVHTISMRGKINHSDAEFTA